jgi:hypothetical protein
MKRIESLEDLRLAVRDLDNRISKYESRVIDLSQRQIVNAHPSIMPYDYVVRRELEQAVAALVGRIGTSLCHWKGKALLLDQNLTVANRVLTVTYLADEIPDNKSIQLFCAGPICKTNPPTGGDAVFKFVRSQNQGSSWEEICTLTIPDGEFQGTETFTFNIDRIHKYDWIDVDVISLNGCLNIELTLAGNYI